MDNKTLKQKTLTGTFWQFAQKMLGQVIHFGISVVLARLLLPSDYGTVALAGMYTILLGLFIGCGLGSALIQKKDVDDLDLCTIFWAQLILACIVYIIVFISAPFFSELFKDEKLTAIVRVSALTMPLSAIKTVQNSIVSRNMAFKTYFYRTLVSSIMSGVIGLGMALYGMGAWALVGQYMSSNIIATITVYSQVRWLPSFKFSKDRFFKLFSYGWKVAGANFIGTLCDQLKGYIIGYHYTKADLAFYNRGEGIPSLISRNITSSITGTLFPALTKLQDDKLAVKRGISRSMKTSSYITMPLFLGLAAISDNLVLLLYTEKWSACIPFMQIVCVIDCIRILVGANLQTLYAIGRSDVVLKLEIYKKPVMIILLIIGAFISPLAICICMLINNIWSLIVNAFPNRKLIFYPLKEQIKDVSTNAILSSSMAIVVYIIGLLSPFNSLISIIIQIIIGAIVYITASHFTKNESYIFVKGTLMEFIQQRRKNGQHSTH